MPVLLFFICVALFLCITFNTFSYLDWKKTAQTALRSYRDENVLHRYLRIFLCVLSILGLIADIILIATGMFNWTKTLAVLALVLLAALFGFVPYSSALWCITEKGVYFARKRMTLTWDELIKTGEKPHSAKTTQITLQVKKGRGEVFKTVFYAVLVPNEKAAEALQIMRDFMDARDRARYMRKKKIENSVETNSRKFY